MHVSKQMSTYLPLPSTLERASLVPGQGCRNQPLEQKAHCQPSAQTAVLCHFQISLTFDNLASLHGALMSNSIGLASTGAERITWRPNVQPVPVLSISQRKSRGFSAQARGLNTPGEGQGRCSALHGIF